jgi:DNA helicase II / ATP-dependent DNA helicase PcrA
MFKPTKEQEKIFTFIKKRPENILIKAYAGCGKTTTIVNALNYIPKDKNITFLAFNRHIKEELAGKLPPYVRCYTTYGLGLAALKKVYPDIEFDEFKIDKIIRSKSKAWNLDEDEVPIGPIYMSSIKKLVNLCRVSLTFKPEFVKSLAFRHEVELYRDVDFKRVLKVLDIASVDRKTYDFTDMIYLPATDKRIWFYPQDYVVVDEVQDLNMCQIKIVEKAIKRNKKSGMVVGRLIGVGDRFQNVYGFNGTTERSFEWFMKYPNTKVLPLSVSFRCSKSVIRHAQTIVPDIKALDDAPEGSVRDGNVLTETKSGDFVLCRTTLPLISLFFQLIEKEVNVMIKGADIGENLKEFIGNFKELTPLCLYWNEQVAKMRLDLISQGVLDPNEDSGFAALNDKVNTLVFLARRSTSIDDLKDKISTIFSDTLQGTVLSTVHKVKGLEADRVFIIRPDLLPMQTAKDWQYYQEKNLEYVAYTRARHDLIFDRNWKNETT